MLERPASSLWMRWNWMTLMRLSLLLACADRQTRGAGAHWATGECNRRRGHV